MEIGMIKSVFLDLDDTVLDFRHAEREAISTALESLGIEPIEALLTRYSEINLECWKLLERGEITREEVKTRRFSILFSELSYNGSPEQTQKIYERALGTSHKFVDGAEEMLEILSKKYDLYIASNGMLNVQIPRIKGADIAKYFKDIFISEQIGKNKPSLEFFEACFSKIEGFQKDNCIIVGDSPSSDILGGKRAGILTCLYNPLGKICKSPSPDYEIKALSELPVLLEKINFGE